jgi:hypothetical protein
MGEILNYNYMNFRRYLKRRDEVGYERAIAEFKREQAEGILDHIVSAGPHQKTVTVTDCLAISKYVDSTYNTPTEMAEVIAFLNGNALLSLESASGLYDKKEDGDATEIT